eukprot:jgi/Mesvir1/18075/Mv09381-RA.1
MSATVNVAVHAPAFACQSGLRMSVTAAAQRPAGPRAQLRASSVSVRKVAFVGKALKPTPPLKPTCIRPSATVCLATVKNVTEADFEQEVLKSDVPVLVDFWALWCGPCKLIAPLMTWVAQEYEGKLKVVKVESDPNPSLVEKYKVYGLPTLMVFRNGAVVEGSKHEGAINKEKLRKLVEAAIPELVQA